ncbi:NACHT, LRR and PYD domains-containing protein 12-like [Tiliqua scincoides]|uniref:NACHT, LRR and PYD domains-containing protein 12-like n=1 Tax=Tiliqua scincoides TaxID=71010 RepID=UPI0034636EE1
MPLLRSPIAGTGSSPAQPSPAGGSASQSLLGAFPVKLPHCPECRCRHRAQAEPQPSRGWSPSGPAADGLPSVLAPRSGELLVLRLRCRREPGRSRLEKPLLVGGWPGTPEMAAAAPGERVGRLAAKRRGLPSWASSSAASRGDQCGDCRRCSSAGSAVEAEKEAEWRGVDGRDVWWVGEQSHRHNQLETLCTPDTPRYPAGAGYRKKYREHVRKKYQAPEDGKSCPGVHVPFSEPYTKLIKASEEDGADEFLQRRWRHRGMVPEQMAATSIDALFSSDSSMAETVVLLGMAGVGKTTMARKILLDWASGRLFPERFDSVFYISCRQLDLVKGQASLADLILKNYPELTPEEAIKELLMNPNKLLFIMDGFDELNSSIELQEDNLSISPCGKNPLSVLLNGLLTKRVFPEACLLITTRPNALGSLENCLQSPRYVGLLGFTAKGREEYFHQFFGDKKLVAQALNYIKRNEALLAMSFVPGVCWIICTVTKQELEGSRGDLSQVPDKVTAVYALYLSHLCASPCNSAERQNLRGLCSLAAEGIWKKRIWFKAEEIQKPGLAPFDSLPPTWSENLFQRDPNSDDIYSFVHLSVQEFLTALFYVFEDEAKDSETAKQETKVLLESKDQGDLSLIVLFMFGLLNRKITKYVQEQFGWKMSSAIQGDLLEWFKGHTQINSVFQNYDQLERFHFLYEIQEKEFVQHALSHWTELKMDWLKFTPLDQAALSFCVKHCLNLETLSLYTCSFLSKGPEAKELPTLPSSLCQQVQKTQKHSEMHLLCQVLKDSKSKIRKLELNGCKLTDGCCADLSTVLSTNQMLAELNLQAARLKDSGLKFLCEGLTRPNCKVEKLRLWGCDRDRCLTHACCSDLSDVFSSSQTLTDLALDYNSFLGDQGVQLLCKGLEHPSCQLQSLGLEQCCLTAASCRDLTPVLCTSKMRKLNLERNKLGDAGVKLLCEGLKYPGCKLQTLLLGTCELTAACCGDLSSVLGVNPTLTELTLDYNVLEDSGVQLLCEGLKQPNCQLRILGLGHCSLTAACCGALSSVLATSQSLTELVVECNTLGDAGVKFLGEGLKHPRCRLQKLNLYNCDLSPACCKDLASVLSSNGMMSELLLGSNKLGELGMKLLCEGLKHPHCRLQKLCLCGSEITPGACKELSSALRMSPMLENLDFWDNPLEDSGVRLLCEGLKDPGCRLQVLSMWNCRLTAASCEDLCSALSTSRNLKELLLEGNELGDAGVRLLCKGLRQPSCRLRKIGLDTDKLMGKTVEELVSLKRFKPDLIIDT